MLKAFLVVFLSMLIGATATADLEKEIDSLTAEQADRIQTKLQAKIYDPLPLKIFTLMSLSISGGVVLANPDEFKGTLDSSFQNEQLDTQGYLNLALNWKVGETERWRVGIGFLRFGQFQSNEIETDVFQEVKLRASYLNARASFKITLAESIVLLPGISVGVLATEAVTVTSSDSDTTSVGSISSHIKNINGENIAGRLNLAFLVPFNPVIALGFEAGYLFANVTELQRSGATDISTPSEINFSGAMVGGSIVFNL